MEILFLIVGIFGACICIVTMVAPIVMYEWRRRKLRENEKKSMVLFEESVPLVMAVTRVENLIYIDVIRVDKSQTVCTVKLPDGQAAELVQNIVERLSA
jgi:hypothetical protein